MPVYEYRCKACGRTSEIEHGFHDERPTKCGHCGGHLVRVFHPVGVVFKGSGFHKTDYAASGLRKEAQAAGDSSDKKESKATAPSSDGKAATEKKPAGEAKPKTAGSGGTDQKGKA